MTFLDYYRENLSHIRGIASEFAAEFPKIAARLELSNYNCQDPYIERLLEGTAFLAARVEHKLESGFPRFLETIASSTVPMATAPIPSYAVINLTADLADERLRHPYTMKRGAQFLSKVPGVETPCVYTSIADVTISAAELKSASYQMRDLAGAGIDDPGGAAMLTLNVVDGDGAGGATMTDDLLAYVDMPDSAASELQGQLIGDLRGIYARVDGVTRKLEGVKIDVPVFSAQPYEIPHVMEGLLTLLRFMASPRLFKFFRVHGLKRCFDDAHGRPVELFFVFSRRVESFARSINANSIRFGCVPVANVFRRHSDRTELSGAYEYHLVADRTAPQNLEILDVLKVEAFDARNQVLFEALPGFEGDGTNRFALHRRARLFHPGRTRSSYHGLEAYVSLSGRAYDEHHDDIRQIGAELLCTNRDLPLLLRKEDPVQPPSSEPITSAMFIDQPSAPYLPLIRGGAAKDWETFGIVLLNLSSILWRDGMIPVEILRRVVRLCALDAEGVAQRLADAISELKATPRTFRFVSHGSPYFESGWRVDLTLKEDACSGTGVFIYARILKDFLFSYLPINSCIEFVVNTDHRKEMFKWVA